LRLILRGPGELSRPVAAPDHVRRSIPYAGGEIAYLLSFQSAFLANGAPAFGRGRLTAIQSSAISVMALW